MAELDNKGEDMKRVIAIALLVVACAVGAGAQDLNWYSAVPATNVQGSTVMSGMTEGLGGMVQLIRTTAIVAPPVWTGNGLDATETLTSRTWFGAAGVFAGLFDTGNSLAAYSLGTSSSVYVRVYDRPTSGAGAMPTAFDYGSGFVGVYYRDTALSLISTLPYDSFTTTYSLDVGTIGAGSWTFLAIPEPGSMALGLIGLGVILIRRRFVRK
jgi:hypothetical protein